MENLNKIIYIDALEGINSLSDNSINLIITSPPYFNCRVYGNETIGREENPLDYINNLFKYLNPLKRVLHKEGSFYLNIGDLYFGTKGFSRNKGRYSRRTDKHYLEYKIAKPDGKYLQYKQLLMLPERIAIEMQNAGWILRNKIIWEKPNPVPSYSKDRRYPVYEHIFHFVKSKKYFFDIKKAKELGHHIIEITSRKGDIVLDPFMGSGTVAEACILLNRNYIGFEINEDFCKIAEERLEKIYDFQY